MLRYEVHQIHLDALDRFYLPLPKLNAPQVSFLSEHLRAHGFKIQTRRGLLRAGSRGGSISVSPIGLASSTAELLDAISPAIPRLLSFRSEPTTTDAFDYRSSYFLSRRIGKGRYAIQLFTRMEGLRTWTELRKTGQCGLTPDEKVVVTSLLEPARGTVGCLTDFLTEASSPVVIGRSLYYRSELPIDDFIATLRTISSPLPRNSFLPRDSTLSIRADSEPRTGEALSTLGEWCYLEYPKNL